jgi:hypothetical protein
MKNLNITEQPNGSEPASAKATARQALVEILEDYGLSVAGFDALRKDAYEKQVAAESPAELGQIYEALLDPGLGFAAARERCPVWPAGSRHQGKLPSMMTLREIKERILLEWSVRDRVKHSGFLKQLQAVGLDNEAVLEAAAMILGEELLTAKLNGKPLSENLRVLDRLMRIAGLQLRQRKEKREQAKRRDAENAEKENPKSNQRPMIGSKVETGNNDKIRMTNGGKSFQELAVGQQERIKKEFKINAEPPNEVILATGYEARDWLPSVKGKGHENLESLVDMVMGGPNGKAKGF